MLRDSISKGLVAICVGLLMAGCDQSTAPPTSQDPSALKSLAAHSSGVPTPSLLVSGIDGGLGSTVGPDGALYVGETQTGRILRVDPKSGVVTTFASGLPPSLFDIYGNGGVMDWGGTTSRRNT